MATNILLPRAIWIGTYWFYDIRLVSCPLPVSVLPAVMGYKMIANQMAGLLGHPVSVLPALHWFAYCQMVHECFKCLWPSKWTLLDGSAGYNGCPSEITAVALSFDFALPHISTLNSLFDISLFVIVVGKSNIPQINCGLIFEKQLQRIGRGGMHFWITPWLF